MATGKIQSGKAKIAYLTDVTSGVSTYGRVVKDPTTSTVRIFVVARCANDMSSSTILAKIPQEFRPKKTEALYGTFVVGASSIASTYYATADTSGNVTQGLSSSLRAVALFGEYEI